MEAQESIIRHQGRGCLIGVTEGDEVIKRDLGQCYGYTRGRGPPGDLGWASNFLVLCRLGRLGLLARYRVWFQLGVGGFQGES